MGTVRHNILEGDDLHESKSYVVADYTAGEALAQYNACYLKSDGKMWKADADAEATALVCAIATEAIDAEASGKFLFYGEITKAGWTWTVGAILFLSTTGGGITETPPSGASDVVIRVGIALSATKILFKPSLEYITV